jgi:hypothetical protein
MRTLFSTLAVTYLLAAWVMAGYPKYWAIHGYCSQTVVGCGDYTWEHSLDEWSRITETVHEPRPVMTYGPFNYHDAGMNHFWEAYGWGVIEVPQ